MQKEIWKDIPDYEGIYQISNIGRVKSLKFNKEKILKNSVCRGYYHVILHKNKQKKTYRNHKLVAMVFLGHVPNGLNIVVDHINNIKNDNRVENLQLITQRENVSKNTKGTSKYTGVHWDKKSKKWVSSIRIKGRLKNLGSFNCEICAFLKYHNELINI